MNEKDKVKVVLAQLGSPKSVKVTDVRSFLREFLGDPRVVDINPTLWKIILNLFVLPFRPKKSAKAYSRIYDGESFPLITGTIDFTNKLRPLLDKNIEINHCFLLSKPRPIDVFGDWIKEDELDRAKEVLIIPQFPQYSESTIASGFDVVAESAKELVNIPSIHFLSHYHRSKAFIDGSVRHIKKYLQDNPNSTNIVISFHGIPLRRVLDKKDIYYRHCYETYHLIKSQITDEKINFHFTFQSRFGSEQWLGPATDDYVMNLKKDHGVSEVGVYCASFVVDCLETTDEIGNELAKELEHIGGKCTLISCLNSDDAWVKDYAKFINTHVNGSRRDKEDLYYEVNAKELVTKMPKQKRESEPLSPEAKKNIKIIFLTLFMDLIGFSIIFPLFPAIAKYYLTINPDDYFLKAIFGSVQALTDVGNVGMSPIVLFGGALGALYSLLQFFAAPFWGGLSDKIGRKPVLLISVFGLFISYVIWFFSGSFTLLILARFIGGIMGGNISTATAVVADVTTPKNRSKGMAFVGIAFALGFILGPALGGIFASVNLSEIYPFLEAYGVNPFSVPALIAALLCAINLYYIATNFKETLVDNGKPKEKFRTSNIIKIFKPLPEPNVNKANLGYFLFLTFFSGMEFTLTFLAVERLSYTPMDNAYMFVFIGLIIAVTQGGYVRRKSNIIGERKMALQGLIATIPGLLIIAIAQSGFLLYLGLFFLSVGSAMVIPNLTALVSLYSPSDIQGKSLGIFRSLGAFGRVIGPIIASVLYWKYNSAVPYYFGTLMMLFPIYIIAKLPDLEKPLD